MNRPRITTPAERARYDQRRKARTRASIAQSISSALWRQAHGRDDPPGVLRAVDSLDSAGLLVTCKDHTMAIKCCADITAWERAVALWHRLSERVAEPQAICTGATMMACARAGMWRRTLAMLAALEGAGHDRDIVPYNIAASACSKVRCATGGQGHGSWERATV